MTPGGNAAPAAGGDETDRTAGAGDLPAPDPEAARRARGALSPARLRELLYWMKLRRAVEDRVVDGAAADAFLTDVVERASSPEKIEAWLEDQL